MRLTLEELRKLLRNREIYLRGARQLGFSTARTLRREGFEPSAFLDASQDLIGQRSAGLPVFAPETIEGKKPGSFFIIITSGFFYTEIAEEYRAKGLVEGRDFVTATDLQAFDYMVDVSGRCNLRCISCPRGNFKPQPSVGFMSPDVYGEILGKIIREDPFVGAVALYQWGEPLLNKRLPEMIRLSTDMGVQTAVSSNLNVGDFSEVIKAGPAWFRVSTSGWGENYEKTHRGGKWELFLRNLNELSRLKKEYAPDMTVEVFYHIYRDRGDDYRRMKELCDELELTMRIRHAALAPLDTVADLIAGRPLSPEAEETRTLQHLTVEESMELALAQKHLPCPYARYLWITWDGYMHLCMEWFAEETRLGQKHFLETPLDEIMALKENEVNAAFCRSCMDRGIHRCYVVYGDETLIESRRSLD